MSDIHVSRSSDGKLYAYLCSDAEPAIQRQAEQLLAVGVVDGIVRVDDNDDE